MKNDMKKYRAYQAEQKERRREERLRKGQALIDDGFAVNEAELVSNRLYIGVSDDMLAEIKVCAGETPIPEFVRDCIRRCLEED